MQWFRAWSEGIVIAVIITTLIEMLLPENNSKKYIKILLGMFIVYIIVFPVISIVANTDVEKSLDLNKVIETSVNVCNTDELENKVDNMAVQIYQKNLENNLKDKLDQNGYVADYVAIKIAEDKSYNIENIMVRISGKNENKKNEKQVYSVVDIVKQINIQVSNNNKENKSVLGKNEEEQIKDFIKELYDVPKEKITIN